MILYGCTVDISAALSKFKMENYKSTFTRHWSVIVLLYFLLLSKPDVHSRVCENVKHLPRTWGFYAAPPILPTASRILVMTPTNC